MVQNFSNPWRWSGNVYLALFLHMIAMMAAYTICRLGFYAYNQQYFAGIGLLHFFRLLFGGFRFDLAALLYINSVYILFYILPFNWRFAPLPQKIAAGFFIVTNAIGLAINIADIIYYRFTLRRTTADIFSQFKNETNIGKLMLSFLVDYWYALLFWAILIILLLVVDKSIKISRPSVRNKLSYYFFRVIAMLVIAYFVVIGIRGGFGASTRPITLSNAGDYVQDPKEISIVLNTPFAMIRTLNMTEIKRPGYYPANEIEKIFTPVIRPDDTCRFKADNVVIIILESFSKEFLGVFNKDKQNGQYKGYTPFLDSLILNGVLIPGHLPTEGNPSMHYLPLSAVFRPWAYPTSCHRIQAIRSIAWHPC